jgi:hypothetical protein
MGMRYVRRKRKRLQGAKAFDVLKSGDRNVLVGDPFSLAGCPAIPDH